jgi:hypothetical protein
LIQIPSWLTPLGLLINNIGQPRPYPYCRVSVSTSKILRLGDNIRCDAFRLRAPTQREKGHQQKQFHLLLVLPVSFIEYTIHVRDLTRPGVIKITVCAALATALLCLPRLSLWSNRGYPIWYLDGVIFIVGFVLWGFVFAWHTKYTGQPVFTLNISARGYAFVTLAGIGVAVALRLFLDPLAKQAMPEDYPVNLEQWLARCLFALSLDQLFLVFAPVAWLMRLFKSRKIAFVLTVLLGLVVLIFKIQHLHTPITPTLFSALFIARLIAGILSVGIYLRGGGLLTLWLRFVVELHFLPF